ncbi:MAG: hypothetical protein II170_01075, partial [Bacteroidaceae bacterium]|nr:hypothetical protein [Bacteroidaceae bacterium]
IRRQCASTSLIQRTFSISYSRADRIMNQLEIIGVVGGCRDDKPCEVLIKDESNLERMFRGKRD